MNPSKLKQEIKSRHTAGIKRTLMVESSPGLGKTQIAAQAAQELGIGFKAIHAPLLQPEDYGLPTLTGKNRDELIFVVSQDKFPLEGCKNTPESGIFLIDELSQADNSAQKVLANLIQEREIHGKRLKSGWSIVATGNTQADRAGANRILGHLANRMTRVALEASLDDWTQWAINNGVKTEVIAFIRFRPELLSNYNARQDVNATPRAWVEGVSASLGVTEAEFETFTGDVGEGPASEFMAFLKVFKSMPNPDRIMLNPKKEEVPSDPATLYALCGALVARTTSGTFDRALTYIKRMPPEFSALYIKDAMAKCPDIATTKAFIDWASKEGAALFN